ncbi:MAG: hypothetical protein ACFFA6_15260 [Promethearchaeota archaeon]
MESKLLTKEELDKVKSIKIGKWDIISEYSRIDWLSKGHNEVEAKIHGIVIAIVGYQARLGRQAQKYKLQKKGKEQGVSIIHRKEERWITTKEFDKIIDKIGKKYYDIVFSQAINNLYNKGYSYDDIKKAVDIPSKIGAKITLDKFLPYI